MEVSKPNVNGVLPEGLYDVVARRNRSYASIKIALCEDGLYRCSVEMQYSYGCFSGPIYIEGEAYVTIDAARTTGLHELLRRWHTPFPSDPQSVHAELAELRTQIETHLIQPSLF